MSTVQLLPGITQKKVKIDRLEVTYLEAGNGSTPIILIHGNCSSSHYFQDFMLALAAKGQFTIYAPDMRGYGDSEVLPVDATRGVRDFSDDLDAFVQAVGLNAFHLLGWSLGGNIVMQYAIDHPGKIRSLTLESPGSPFGFGGTKDAIGTPTWSDFAGSGGGTANPDFVQRIAQGDRGTEQFSPRTTINTFYYKPPFRTSPDREEIYLSSLLTTKVAP
ncbi:MAG TPA: alpha/beta hydrolase, partial [Ktedonobacteraceae bacterium]|nr:alpha/beta hydrolase [Ktedonobacteraceae bacterium]